MELTRRKLFGLFGGGAAVAVGIVPLSIVAVPVKAALPAAKALDIKSLAERVITPAMVHLARQVDADILQSFSSPSVTIKRPVDFSA